MMVPWIDRLVDDLGGSAQFLALHCQEVGGKSPSKIKHDSDVYRTWLGKIRQFFDLITSRMHSSRYDLLLAVVDSELDSAECYTVSDVENITYYTCEKILFCLLTFFFFRRFSGARQHLLSPSRLFYRAAHVELCERRI